MKLRNIFTILAAALSFAFVGCQVEERFLDEVKVSQSFVAIPVEGGSVDVTVNAEGDWAIAGVPEWLTVSPASGSAGETVVTFSAAATSSTNEAILELVCEGATQMLTVFQMAEKVEVPLSTCKEVINGVDGVVYRVKGTVTSIANTTYGNWYLQDETGTVYVYGTLYEGAEKQFDKIGIEVGDIVTVEGPRKDYSGTIELVNVTVIAIEKSLIKVDEVSPEDATLPVEGGDFTVTLTAKGEGVTVEVPAAAQSWLSVTGVSYAGTTATVTFTAAANNGGDRQADLTFVTTSKGTDYTAVTTLKQKGSIIECSIADFLAQPDGTALYRLSGKVGKIANTTYGNFDLIDATGTVYVYGLTNNGAIGSNDKTFASLGIKEGDKITIIGTRASYNGTAQVGGTAYLVSHETYTEVTNAEFLAKETGDAWYKLTGKVTNLQTGDYGNFDLVDAAGTSVYVYGLTVAPVAKNDKSFPKLGVKEGDTVTLIGKRAAYNGNPQVGGPAYYISHESSSEGGDTPVVPASGKYVKVTSALADWSGKYLIVWGSKAHASLTSKDLNPTADVTISNNTIEPADDLASAVMTVAKNGDKYSMAFANGKYFGMQHNGCLLCDSAFDLTFEYTADGIKIGGVPSGKDATYYLYANTSNGAYYRCYVDKNGQSGYAFPELYKYSE